MEFSGGFYVVVMNLGFQKSGNFLGKELVSDSEEYCSMELVTMARSFVIHSPPFVTSTNVRVHVDACKTF
jgi:hypothetical protein